MSSPTARAYHSEWVTIGTTAAPLALVEGDSGGVMIQVYDDLWIGGSDVTASGNTRGIYVPQSGIPFRVPAAAGVTSTLYGVSDFSGLVVRVLFPSGA